MGGVKISLLLLSFELEAVVVRKPDVLVIFDRFLQVADSLRLQRTVMVSEEEKNVNRLESAPPKWVGPHGHRWFAPHVIFVHNRCEPEDFTPARVEFLQVRQNV
jgi:hypothetical protein